MATESAKEWGTQALAIPRPLPAWRQLAAQQWLIGARARLQIRSVLASRMNDYLVQVQKNLEDRQTAIEEQLAVYENPPGSTPSAGPMQSTVSRIIAKLANNGTVSADALNNALTESGYPKMPKTLAQAAIADYFLK